MAQPLRFSRYEVLQHPDGSPQVLGEDTEITIYLAREKESGTSAVLRVPGHRSQRNPAVRHRFLEEAQEMAQVKHPHIASVLHSSDTSAGAFCAMEFCDGLTLQKAIEEVGALPWQETFRLALQLSSALEALERHGLVHRGLRSTNIIVTTGADGHAHLKITEYGRVSEETIRDTLAATKSGFIRVPAYASPEEFLAVAPPDARSLQYSLGAVLWFCLTGKPLFEGTQFEVMFQHVNKEPDWRQLSALPSQLLGIMKLMLAKSAGDRFASCAALTAALSSATAGVNHAPRQQQAQATLDAPITGPTALAWLKARQTLMLDEVHPMLGQIADLMDAGVAEGKDMLDASLERVVIEIEGWATLPDGQRAALLRTPLTGWPVWKVKLSPHHPSDRNERPPSQAMGFVRLCHRLLTGQGKGNHRHVPTAALSAEGNAFFEKHLESHAVRGLSCRRLFEMLCEVEEIVIGESGGTEVLATRVVARPGGGAPGSAPASTDDRQHAWLARERAALERARRELSEQEAQRARQLAEEQAHVEKLRKSLEDQKKQLEEKRREQQRLEQELQLRAQLEFQKLQEEAKARDSLLAHKRAAAEEALRQREAEFRARERERFARLEQLKQENDAMEERVQQEYLTLRHVERKHAHNTEQFQSERLAVPKATPPLASKSMHAAPAQHDTPRHTPQPQQQHTPPQQHVQQSRSQPAPSRAAPVQTVPPAAKPPQPRPQESRAQAAAPPPQTTKPATTPAPRPTSGSIVLARLTPIEVPQKTVTPAAQDDSRVQRPMRRRRRLIRTFIGVLIAGVLALIAAAAITLLSGGHDEESESNESTQNSSVADKPQEFELTAPATFETTTPGETLRELVGQVRSDATQRDALRPRAVAAVTALAGVPPAEATPFMEDIRNAAEAWRMPEAWLALAALTQDEDKRLEHYLQAATLGNTRARTYAGAVLLNKGVANREAAMIQQGVTQLSEAVSAGDPDAMLILGDAMYEARGLVQDRTGGRALVERAAAQGHEGAKEWLKARQ